MVLVKFVGIAKSFVGAEELEIPLDKTTKLNEVLSKLYELNPKVKQLIANEDGSLKRDFIVLLNGVDVELYEDPLNVSVNPSDEITILPIVHGGSDF